VAGLAVTEKKKMDRQTLGVLIALGFGFVIVGAVLFITLSAGDSGDPSAPTTVPADAQQSPQTQPPAQPSLDADVELPPGDYQPYCAELDRQGASAEQSSSIAGIKEVFAKLDFDALIASAPEGIKPDLLTVASVRDEVVALLAPAEDVSDIDPADFPQEFVSSMPVLLAAAGTCSLPG